MALVAAFLPSMGAGVAGAADPPETASTISVGPAGVFGRGWTDGSTVTLSINGEFIASTPVQVGGSLTGADFQLGNASPQEGDVVVVEDDVPAPDTTTRTHTAQYVTVDQPDNVLDTVSGIGPSDDALTVQAWSADYRTVLATRHVAVTPSPGPGEPPRWQADFANPGPDPDEQDIVALAGLSVVATTSPDAEGNTSYSFFNPPLQPGQWITNPATGLAYSLTDPGLSFVDAEAQAVSWGGHLVTIDDQAEQDWLFGQAGLSMAAIGLNDVDSEGSFVWVSGDPVTYTNWCPGEPNDYLGEDFVQLTSLTGCWNDIPHSNQWIVEVESPPGPGPSFLVFPATSSVFGQGWPDGETVAVEIDDPATPAAPDFAGVSTVVGEPCPPGPCGSGNFGLLSDPYIIKAGDVVTAYDGTTVKSHTVTALAVTGVDAVADTVTGTAETGSEVGVNVQLPDGFESRSVTADAQGDWTVDFSLAEGSQQPYDIQPGSFPFPQSAGFATQGDEDGDSTFVQWDGGPNFNVGDNAVWGDRWGPGSELTITVAGTPGYSTTAVVEENGTFIVGVDPNEFQIQAGDVVTVTDGTAAKVHTVTTLAVADVDAAADTVTGTAPPNSEIVVATGELVPGQWLDLRLRSVTTDAQGAWTADFSVASGPLPEDQPKDIGPGSYGFATQMDDDGDQTLRNWWSPPNRPAAADFDGDGASDVAVYRPGGNGWFVQGGLTTSWGVAGDIPVPADFNGDGVTDVAVFRPSDQTWYVQPSDSFPGGFSTQWGVAGDVPVPADFNGDGVTDVAVFRPSDQTWYAQPSDSFPGGLATQWGVPGDVPIPADFNGDGADEVAVFRPADQTWYSQDGLATQWGVTGDIPIPVDFNGDGSDEVAVFRPSDQTWYSQSSPLATQWGVAGDMAVPGDYDGDGDAEVAVFRPSDQTWYVQGGLSTQWGATGDVPVIVPYALSELY